MAWRDAFAEADAAVEDRGVWTLPAASETAMEAGVWRQADAGAGGDEILEDRQSGVLGGRVDPGSLKKTPGAQVVAVKA